MWLIVNLFPGRIGENPGNEVDLLWETKSNCAETEIIITEELHTTDIIIFWALFLVKLCLPVVRYEIVSLKVILLQNEVDSLQSRFTPSCPDGTEIDFLYKNL